MPRRGRRRRHGGWVRSGGEEPGPGAAPRELRFVPARNAGGVGETVRFRSRGRAAGAGRRRQLAGLGVRPAREPRPRRGASGWAEISRGPQGINVGGRRRWGGRTVLRCLPKGARWVWERSAVRGPVRVGRASCAGGCGPSGAQAWARLGLAPGAVGTPCSERWFEENAVLSRGVPTCRSACKVSSVVSLFSSMALLPSSSPALLCYLTSKKWILCSSWQEKVEKNDCFMASGSQPDFSC